MGIRLTLRLLLAMEEALSARTAGEIDISDDPDSPTVADYDDAWSWVAEQAAKREAKLAAPRSPRHIPHPKPPEPSA